MSITFSIRKDGKFLEPDINLGQRNALLVLRTLGYLEENDCCGFMDSPAQVQEFIEKCDSALASIRQFASLDPGIEPSEGTAESGVRFFDCGQRPGYITEKLEQLRSLAQLALESGTSFSWG